MQRVDDEALVRRIHRQPVEDFLVVDELRPLSPLALAMAKRVLNHAYDGPLPLGLEVEGLAYGLLRTTHDFREGVEAFDAAWTEIRNTHFDKTMNGVDWDAVRTELRPRAEAARTMGEVRGAIRRGFELPEGDDLATVGHHEGRVVGTCRRVLAGVHGAPTCVGRGARA